MTGLMDSIAIKDINRAANKVLDDMITDNFKQFKLKDKEDIIINNSSNLNELNNHNIHFDINFELKDCIKIIMINGILDKNLSDQIPDDYYIESIENSKQKNLSKIASFNKNPIIANNTANFKDGVYIESKGECEKPIYLINYLLNEDSQTIVYPRVFIQCNENSNVKVIEHTVSSNNSKLFSNYVTEINCSENSNLEYYILQTPGSDLYISGNTSIDMHKASNAKIISYTIGGDFIKNYISCNLSEEYSELILDGIFIGRDKEYIDNDTAIYHNAPYSNSSEKYKGILKDKSQGSFNGMVYVAKKSHNINSNQYNNNILLSKDAKINSNPQLEIYCDDVQCAHGSTIGELDEDAILYLRSRGISLDESKNILLNGFVNEVTDKVSIPSLKINLINQINDWME